MTTRELHRLPVETDTDFLHAHELALLIARQVGAKPRSQILFAATVAEYLFSHAGTGAYIQFSLSEQHQKTSLLALFNGKNEIASIELEDPAGGIELFVSKNKKSAEWKTRKQLEEGYLDMERVTFAIAHDLKNSVTKLKLSLEMVNKETLPEDTLQYMGIIDRSASRLENTLQSMNQLIELGHLSEDVVKPLTLSSLLAQVQEEFTDSIAAGNVVIKTSFTANDIVYIETYLRSIFSNLLSNAIKYAHPDRPLVLDITTEKEGDKIIVNFSDNGIGIDLARHGDKLFLPFTRFSANTEGSGIGLYLIRNMLERNGGGIEVHSSVDQGSRFRIILTPYAPGYNDTSSQ